MGIFLGEFSGMEDMCREFQVDHRELYREGVHVLLAIYDEGKWEGSAFVLCIDDSGKLSEVNASHCSCFGLEGQWEPEETSEEALRYRMEEGWLASSWRDEKGFRRAMEYVFGLMPILLAE